jgi:hypothetical protein
MSAMSAVIHRPPLMFVAVTSASVSPSGYGGHNRLGVNFFVESHHPSSCASSESD